MDIFEILVDELTYSFYLEPEASLNFNQETDNEYI